MVRAYFDTIAFSVMQMWALQLIHSGPLGDAKAGVHLLHLTFRHPLATINLQLTLHQVPTVRMFFYIFLTEFVITLWDLPVRVNLSETFQQI